MIVIVENIPDVTCITKGGATTSDTVIASAERDMQGPSRLYFSLEPIVISL